MGCSAPLVSLEMPACGWGPWAWYQPRRKSCEQHSALGGVPALLRGEGVGGGRSVPPYPKEFYKDTDCSLVFDNPILHIPAGLLPFLCSSPPFTTCSGFCLLFSLLWKLSDPPQEAQPGASRDPHTLTPIPSSILYLHLGLVTIVIGGGRGGKGNEVFLFCCGIPSHPFRCWGGRVLIAFFCHATQHSVIQAKNFG